MDETYVGGKRMGYGRVAGRDNKEIVIAIRQRDGQLRMFHASDLKANSFAKYIRENISDDVEVFITDEFSSYPYAIKMHSQ